MRSVRLSPSTRERLPPTVYVVSSSRAERRYLEEACVLRGIRIEHRVGTHPEHRLQVGPAEALGDGPEPLQRKPLPAAAVRCSAWFGVWGTAHRPPPAELRRGVTDDGLAVAE